MLASQAVLHSSSFRLPSVVHVRARLSDNATSSARNLYACVRVSSQHVLEDHSILKQRRTLPRASSRVAMVSRCLTGQLLTLAFLVAATAATADRVLSQATG